MKDTEQCVTVMCFSQGAAKNWTGGLKHVTMCYVTSVVEMVTGGTVTFPQFCQNMSGKLLTQKKQHLSAFDDQKEKIQKHFYVAEVTHIHL